MSHFPAWRLFFIQIPKRYVRTDVRYDRYTERIMLTCIKKKCNFRWGDVYFGVCFLFVFACFVSFYCLVWSQEILFPQPPEYLGLQICTTIDKSFTF